MSTSTNDEVRHKTRPDGPQGTQRISAEQVADLLEQAGSETGHTHDARLVGLGDPIAGQSFTLRSDRVTIGRSSLCDIHIDEPSLSSEHARLDRTEEGWRIVNLLSTNGVFINDGKVFSRQLHDQDVIGLGRLRLRFEDPYAEPQRGRATAQRRPGWRLAALLLTAVALAALTWLWIR